MSKSRRVGAPRTWRLNNMVVHSEPKRDTEIAFAFEVHEDPRRDLGYRCLVDKLVARDHAGVPSWVRDVQHRAAYMAAEMARTAFFEARRPKTADAAAASLPPVHDMYALSEDDRIAKIVEAVASSRGIIGVLLDDERAKVERYKRKLSAAGVVVLDETPGPVARVVTLRVGPQ